MWVKQFSYLTLAEPLAKIWPVNLISMVALDAVCSMAAIRLLFI